MTRPAYLHNRVLMRLSGKLFIYFESNPFGEVLNSENLYALSSATRRSPDIGIILGDRRKELPGAKVIPIVPDIAVEVLSPSETPRMIHRKLKQYFEAGVKEVWLIDPESREAELWTGLTLPGDTLGEEDPLASPLLPGFALRLGDLF
jgi:Uma2 family endonuclease